MYRIIPQQIPQDRRAEINEKILFCIDTGKNELPPETIYNCYTGAGGLHNLKLEDFTSYHEYSQAKKEFEMGQFFTPHEICRDMAGLIKPDRSDMVLDMCCGMGNFFNHLPNPHNVYGFDIDGKAVSVARYLYPEAHIEKCDIFQYKPDKRFDVVIGNPPFNLEFDRQPSQFYYMGKAHSVLNPAGILMIIVPCSFLQNEFWEKTRVTVINRDFSFIGQTKLDANAFAGVGVHNFNTKIMAFMRESRHIEMTPYNAEEFVSWEELGKRIDAAGILKANLKVSLMRETHSINREELERFEYKLSKYLFELKTHKHLQKHYDKAVALVAKLRNQQPPEDCSNEQFKEWERNKLTTVKVLGIIRKYITSQHVIHRKEVALVKTNYGFKLKQYAPRLLDGIKRRFADMNDLVLERDALPVPPEYTSKIRKQVKAAEKLIRRKQREYEKQSLIFSEMNIDPDIQNYLDNATFINKEQEVCRFTNLQKHDLNLVLQKRYSLLNWQQGSGKTAAVYHYAKYLLKYRKVRNVIVLAPAIATNLTWETFLKMNRERYYTLRSYKDFGNIPEGAFLVVSISMLSKLKRDLSRLIKLHSRKFCLIFDESDEITNPVSQRTKAALSIFRRLNYKILDTGTTTRNHITELYSQFELLYNNSINMMCRCDRIYYQDKGGDIVRKINDYYGEPFPAYQGHTLFKACFCPGKASVFGIEKQNQDIYNKGELFDLIGKTIITRKFKDFAGEKYEVKTHSVTPSDGEREVYRVIVEEFCRICELYYNSTGDSKKEAGLRLMRQIRLLVKACSVPNLIDGYSGDPYPNKTRYIKDMVKSIPGKVTIGCTTLAALDMYEQYVRKEFPNRPVFIIKGDVTFKKRQSIITEFEDTLNGILICTQQSLKSSANIPTCNDVILESLQWNIPKMEQFYFRFIRLDSKDQTRVHFVTYEDSIEQNLMALVLTKERLNEFIKTGEVKEQSEIFEEFDITMSVIESLLTREQDSEGKFHISWGRQRLVC
ncbi:N-6 DNA methylase [Dysgonomonas sp. GY75]|uniref:N-6 DNA methylase n=1 Tax=Dysgonomonas sp. GY75 TaxID=2780419 RepID=UPI001883FCFC|nr:N-6 DNA methylase [Dysgonomonas sp. GY75]MBF0649260.1 N-6 DNA methylase [Dysgonomonas sp. GY75]